MLDYAIQKGVITKQNTNDPAQKGRFFFFRKFLSDYLTSLNVPFNDACCPTASSQPVKFDTTLKYWNGSAWVTAPVPEAELAPVTASRALVSDAGGLVTASAVTATQLGYVDATSSIQTQLNSKVTEVAAPSTASSAGTAGQIAYDATHIYVCVATNTWVRATLATF